MSFIRSHNIESRRMKLCMGPSFELGLAKTGVSIFGRSYKGDLCYTQNAKTVFCSLSRLDRGLSYLSISDWRFESNYTNYYVF
uniref:Uncharacterized protein n=1 Tax=Lepeophtheirus salmonis TaxID=72036 RepID=A0A0K2U8Z6_LEPSM